MMKEIFTPGRTELAGNHTDHQKGRILASAVDLGSVCVSEEEFFVPPVDPLTSVLLTIGVFGLHLLSATTITSATTSKGSRMRSIRLMKNLLGLKSYVL